MYFLERYSQKTWASLALASILYEIAFGDGKLNEYEASLVLNPHKRAIWSNQSVSKEVTFYRLRSPL